MTTTAEQPKPAAPNNGQKQELSVTRANRLTVHDDGQFADLMDTGRFEHLWRLAQMFASSNMVLPHFQNNPANCFVGIQMAMRMRLDPFMVMQNLYIVYGRPGMEAKLVTAMINKSGLFKDPLDYEIQGTDPYKDDYAVRAFAERKGTGKVVYGPWITWKLVRAEGWDKKQGSKWLTMAEAMFQYRASSWFGKHRCPELILGMSTLDELLDSQSVIVQEQTTLGTEKGKESKAAALVGKLHANNNVVAANAEAVKPDKLADAEANRIIEAKAAQARKETTDERKKGEAEAAEETATAANGSGGANDPANHGGPAQAAGVTHRFADYDNWMQQMVTTNDDLGGGRKEFEAAMTKANKKMNVVDPKKIPVETRESLYKALGEKAGFFAYLQK
jgi:hypothetical protein